jgi:hypothetical protein
LLKGHGNEADEAKVIYAKTSENSVNCHVPLM